MNHSSSGLLLSKAIDGFLRFIVVEGLSETTMASYRDHLDRFLEHVEDIPLTNINSSKIEGYIYWLRTDYVPQRITGNTKPLSPKTIYNIWVSLKSFFAWACRQEFIVKNPMDGIPRPRFSIKPIDPFTRKEIEQLLGVCKYSRVVKPNNRRPFKMLRRTYRRDRALVLFLLDTGVRASELCALQIGDVDMKSGEVTIKHGRDGGAKGAQGRSVFAGKAVRQSLWRYFVEREDGEDYTAPLFVIQPSPTASHREPAYNIRHFPPPRHRRSRSLAYKIASIVNYRPAQENRRFLHPSR